LVDLIRVLERDERVGMRGTGGHPYVLNTRELREQLGDVGLGGASTEVLDVDTGLYGLRSLFRHDESLDEQGGIDSV